MMKAGQRAKKYVCSWPRMGAVRSTEAKVANNNKRPVSNNKKEHAAIL
jgi:hypothetical protein